MLKFNYNKIELIRIRKQLDIREKALPTLKSKEAALRLEVQKRKKELKELKQKLSSYEKDLEELMPFFAYYREAFLKIVDVKFSKKKIAGVMVYKVDDIIFREDKLPSLLFDLWFVRHFDYLKEYMKIYLEYSVLEDALKIVEKERKKTTQKVNLYEKVQIPEFKEAIRKIKRFLEDVDNLDRASQKLMKKRLYNMV